MIEEKLELIIVTYNRDSLLDNTLKQLLNSPFSGCKLTILNNCSEDNTLGVCRKYYELFPNFNIITNKCNIGGNANITKAYYTSSMEYTWVLGDDDDFDFSKCDDVIEAIESGRYDFIYVSSPLLPSIKDKNDITLNEVLEENNFSNEMHVQDIIPLTKGKFFMDMGFISSHIFKSEYYDSETLIKAYDNIPNFFPHFAFISRCVNENFLLYKSENDLVIQGKNPDNMPNHSYAYTKFYQGWLHSGLMINDKNIRKIFYKNLDNLSIPTNNYLIVLPVAIMTDKALGKKDNSNNVISLMSAVFKHTGWIKGFLISLYLFIVYLVPSSVYRVLFKKVYGRE